MLDTFSYCYLFQLRYQNAKRTKVQQHLEKYECPILFYFLFKYVKNTINAHILFVVIIIFILYIVQLLIISNNISL